LRARARDALGAPAPELVGCAAVVTVPLAILRDGAIRFVPALDAHRRAAAALEVGPVVKIVLRFRRAPWPRGRRAPAFLHAPGAPVPVSWTLAPAEAPLLLGWAGGPDAARLARLGEQGAARAAAEVAATR
jgi:monoamine oxidase